MTNNIIICRKEIFLRLFDDYDDIEKCEREKENSWKIKKFQTDITTENIVHEISSSMLVFIM